MPLPNPQPALSIVRDRRRAEVDREVTRRRSILLATEQLLDEIPLHDISVAQIIEAAEVSRKTFYSYFESKYEVAAALLAAVMDDMFELLGPFVDRDPVQSREDAIREMLATCTELWSEHRAIFRTVHDHRHAVPELREQWLLATERFTDAVASELQREVAAGTAPAGIDIRQRAATVVWSTEHLLYVAGTRIDDDLPDERAILETLITMWVGTLFGPPQERSA